MKPKQNEKSYNLTIRYSHESEHRQVYKVDTVIRDNEEFRKSVLEDCDFVERAYKNDNSYTYSVYIARLAHTANVVSDIAWRIMRHYKKLGIGTSGKIIWSDGKYFEVFDDGCENPRLVTIKPIHHVKSTFEESDINGFKGTEVRQEEKLNAVNFGEPILTKMFVENFLNKSVTLAEMHQICEKEKKDNPLRIVKTHEAIKYGSEVDKDREISKLLFQNLQMAIDEVADELDKVKGDLERGMMFIQDSHTHRKFIMCVDRLRSMVRGE